MAVMDADTGTFLNYRHLMQITKYRKAWRLSSANKFGSLANDIVQNKEPYQHHRAHLPTQCTNSMKERCHIWAFCLRNQTKKGRTQSNTIHHRRRQDQLQWQSCRPNRGHAGGQNALQQCDLHKRCTLHDNGHIQLLPNDTFALS